MAEARALVGDAAACGHERAWWGLYRGGWDLLPDDAYGHPAKMAPGLCHRILSHLSDLGLTREGDTILDPMGGTGMTALCATLRGYRAVTVELEERFVGFQRDAKARMEAKVGRALDWTILQGDARRLDALLAERVGAALTSPPYGETNGGPSGIDWEKAGRPDRLPENKPAQSVQGVHEWRYGQSPGQIGALPLKALTSPPYAGHVSDSPSDPHPERMEGGGRSARGQYGQTPGQIGALKCVTSPPYVGSLTTEEDHERRETRTGGFRQGAETHYGDSPNTYLSKAPIGLSNEVRQHLAAATSNIGALSNNETYTDAMRQVYASLAKVSDTLAVVTKDPTRQGALYPLGDLTARLLEETGWRVVCRHRAVLFEETETADLFGQPVKRPRGRLSFFKALAYKRGSPVARWEDVLVAVRS